MEDGTASSDTLLPRSSCSNEAEPELEYGEKRGIWTSRNANARSTAARLPLALGLLLGVSLVANVLLAIVCRDLILKDQSRAIDPDRIPKKSKGLYCEFFRPHFLLVYRIAD
jgi:hypothetical protein